MKMKQKSQTRQTGATKAIKDIRRATMIFEHFRVPVAQYQKGIKRISTVAHLHSRGTRPKAVPEEYFHLGTFRIKRFEFLTQGLSFMWSQTHAYKPGLAGLMLGGKDRSC
jgi:hypothetical protein